jgi:hypothetical protein
MPGETLPERIYSKSRCFTVSNRFVLQGQIGTACLIVSPGTNADRASPLAPCRSARVPSAAFTPRTFSDAPSNGTKLAVLPLTNSDACSLLH